MTEQWTGDWMRDAETGQLIDGPTMSRRKMFLLIRELRAVIHAHAQTIRDKQAVIEGVLKKVAKLEAEALVSDEMYEAQWKKFEDCPHSFGGDTHHLCACSLDHLSDVCAVHAPRLKEALERVADLEAVIGHIAAAGRKAARDAP